MTSSSLCVVLFTHFHVVKVLAAFRQSFSSCRLLSRKELALSLKSELGIPSSPFFFLLRSASSEKGPFDDERGGLTESRSFVWPVIRSSDTPSNS